jgi:hypothetical protein
MSLDKNIIVKPHKWIKLAVLPNEAEANFMCLPHQLLADLQSPNKSVFCQDKLIPGFKHSAFVLLKNELSSVIL